MTFITLDGVSYWLHVGECNWIETETGKRVYDINLINKLFGML